MENAYYHVEWKSRLQNSKKLFLSFWKQKDKDKERDRQIDVYENIFAKALIAIMSGRWDFEWILPSVYICIVTNPNKLNVFFLEIEIRSFTLGRKTA